MVTRGVIEAQAVQFWYGFMNKEFKCWMRNAILLHHAQPTLANVF
jgi:hypothetical protein